MVLCKQSFKPQRGKFTPKKSREARINSYGFKPQRGKFTLWGFDKNGDFTNVSNPNGVNLHKAISQIVRPIRTVSNPNGVNLHQLRLFLRYSRFEVSNPNGVNLHTIILIFCSCLMKCFKPQRGKFTPMLAQKNIQNKKKFQTPTG